MPPSASTRLWALATDAIDRLHSTRTATIGFVIAEIMGHRAGWLTLGAGIAGGADVILIPELPYDIKRVAGAIQERSRHGTNFSIVAVAGRFSRSQRCGSAERAQLPRC